MKFGVPGAVGKTFARQALVINKNSPTILFGAGVVGMVTSTVLACRATLKIEEVLDRAQAEIDLLREDQESSKRELTVIQVRTAGNLARLYAPAIVVGGASIAALTKSHNILGRRNAALGAAYAALDMGFNEYRRRVVEKYGEEEDRHLRYGAEQVEITNDKGKKQLVLRVQEGEPSIYARFFDPLSTSWSKDPEINLLFVTCQQTYANDLLNARGHVFLNEVYDMLGIERTQAGSVVGWILGEGNDNYVDFGIYEQDDKVRDFVNGRENSILLDFNVDGVIFDKIGKHDGGTSWQKR